MYVPQRKEVVEFVIFSVFVSDFKFSLLCFNTVGYVYLQILCMQKYCSSYCHRFFWRTPEYHTDKN